jgi:hypothetical protein
VVYVGLRSGGKGEEGANDVSNWCKPLLRCWGLGEVRDEVTMVGDNKHTTDAKRTCYALGLGGGLERGWRV